MMISEVIGTFRGRNRRKQRHAVGKAVVVTTLVAGAAGAAAGLLTAPKAGAETRQDVADFARDKAESLKAVTSKTATELKDKADFAAREVRKQARQMRRDSRANESHMEYPELDPSKRAESYNDEYETDSVAEAAFSDETKSKDHPF